jgi:hypothetical protein
LHSKKCVAKDRVKVDFNDDVDDENLDVVELPPIPGGVMFYSQMNSKSRFFLPSVENDFAGVLVEKVMCDSGCNSLLLPITIPLSELLKKFPSIHNGGQYWWSISTSNGVGGQSQVLIIDTDPSAPVFTISLMKNIIGGSFKISKLRFQLCGDDINEILSNKTIKKSFSKECIGNLKTSNLKRKGYALLGQDILKLFSCIRHGRIAVYVDVNFFQIPQTWVNVKMLMDSLKARGRAPSDFKDWEDDSASYDDEDSPHDLDDGEYFDE